MEGWFLGVWGAATVVQLAWLAFLTAKAQRTGTPEQIQSEVRQLAVDVEELYGAVEKWTKRRYAAEAREKIGKVAVTQVPERGTAAYKAFLRMKSRGEVQ